jgi:hypothetical protein
MNPLAMIRLKNGSEEPQALIAVSMIALKSLIGEDPISFYELVMKARDRNHKVFSQHQTDVLKGLSLMEPSGNLHQSVTNVVLSAVTGDGLSMTLGDPVAR